ncbi:hypothetical protein CONPUDRAFT_133797 [Coniophora puteana RWD-64-598 SS2]|uniref:RNA-binding domain-containing protein n=1 Tax=Coniophora puteana (strain RWD-64-598) TaxID=741705 RepID=A0A5M3N4N0_CONPW|nr:uncharacterized protein CONPUDRAFT_133797 [Coniophora puteana RWD-64-598 SS2]EIW86353.1 hypothetical protein CONPUDRAFT_133797 [Coniophora puteana RWD-64-598 SS2]
MAASPRSAMDALPSAHDSHSADAPSADNMGPSAVNPPPGQDDPMQGSQGQDEYRRGSSVDNASNGNTMIVIKTDGGREKQVKANKVYVGGLPEHTQTEDLQNCFGKLGSIVAIELKTGFGFVEFDSREAAEESVAKYNEGYFMGNKIRVELSHSRGRITKHVSSDPSACFKCGQPGHWARECPNGDGSFRPPRRGTEPGMPDRTYSRDYPPPSRDYPPRDEFGPSSRYPPRDSRHYDYPSSGRDYRRPPSPRDVRDYPVAPAPPARTRDFDDYRSRPPPAAAAPPARYDRPYPGDRDASYSRSFPPPPPRDAYDRYDRRPPVDDRYAYAAAAPRPRTPPGPPPRARDDYERPPRDYPPPAEHRPRPMTPPRYPDYPPPRAGEEAAPQRYRRRSMSPPARSAGHYDSAGYSGAAPYNNGNGYAGRSGDPPPRGGSRDYPPRGREPVEANGHYRR